MSQFHGIRGFLAGKTPTRRMLAAILAVAIVVGVAAAYALNQVSINNNVTINNGLNLKANLVGPASTSPVCSSSTGSYTDSGLSTSWTLNQGGSQTQYICLENVGTVSDSLHFVTNPSTLSNSLTIANTFSICNNGSCTVGNSLAPGAFALATVVLTASPSSATGTTSNVFSITFT
jgi:hypothetical protein